MTPVEKFTAFLENLSPERISEMDDLFAPDVDFLDPINTALDLEHLKRIEKDLFKQLKEIRFKVEESAGEGEEAFVKWVMNYKFRIWKRQITGVSHLKFNEEGKISYQHDYWDASFPIYGEFPPLGWIMKGIKKMLSVKP